MLMSGMPCERAKLARSEDVRMPGRLLVIEERGLGLGQALGTLDCDLAGAEATIVMMFGRKYLSSMHAAPEEDG